MALELGGASVIGSDEHVGGCAARSHAPERVVDPAHEGVGERERAEVARVIIVMAVLVGLAQRDVEHVRTLRLEMTERELRGEAIGPEVADAGRGVDVLVAAATHRDEERSGA